MGHLSPELLEFVDSWLPPSPARVLEVGCGDGAMTRRLAGEGYEAVGLDPGAPDGDVFVRAALEEFRPASHFDAAVAIRSLHHLHDPARALDNLRAAIRPGGRLVVFEFAIENVDGAARRWLDDRGLPPPVTESEPDEVIPLADLRAQLTTRFLLVAEEPATYLAREAGRDELNGEEEDAIRAGTLKPAGMRLAFERD